MNLSPYEIALIAGGFTIIGVLLGAWIGYRNALKIYSITEFNKAAAIFRDSFLPEVTFLRHNANIANLGSSSDLGELLQYAYVHRHLKAIEVFRAYLSSKQRMAIDQAWQKYCCHPDNPELLYFEQYSYKSTERETKGESLKQLALHRIDKILEFGKHK